MAEVEDQDRLGLDSLHLSTHVDHHTDSVSFNFLLREGNGLTGFGCGFGFGTASLYDSFESSDSSSSSIG